MATRTILEEGMALHRANRLDEAREKYVQALAVEPNNPDAFHLLGLITCRTESAAKGVNLIWQAVSLNPLLQDAWLNLSNILVEMEQREEAYFALLCAKRHLGDHNPLNARLKWLAESVEATYCPRPDCQVPHLGAIYKAVFGFRSHGRFLEIGAYDGSSFSNTAFLADLGWSGTYVEPLPSYAEACRLRHRHNDVAVIPYAIGPVAGCQRMSVAGVLSSLAQHHVEAFSKIAWSKGFHSNTYVDVEIITPANLYDLLPGEDIDVMSLDVEGFEWPIIEHWDFERLRPMLAIVESRDESPEFDEIIREESLRVIARFLDAGYEIFWRDSGNIVFADSRRVDLPRGWLTLAGYHERHGRRHDALAVLEHANKIKPRDLSIVANRVFLLADTGQADQSISLFKSMETVLPDLGYMHPRFTPKWLAASARHCEPFARRTAQNGLDVVAVSSLAYYGRFSHTVGNYLVARIYAETRNLELLTPDWVGHWFFALDDPPLEAQLPVVNDEYALTPLCELGFAGTDVPYRNIDLFSPYGTFLHSRWKGDIRRWLTPRVTWHDRLQPVVAALRQSGHPLVAVHIRLTDMRKHQEHWGSIPPMSLYVTWLRTLKSRIGNFILFVASDEQATAVPALSEFSPVTLGDLGLEWLGLEFLQDFYVLTQADFVAVSMGSFGTLAAALNPKALEIVRPDTSRTRLEPFDPWIAAQ